MLILIRIQRLEIESNWSYLHKSERKFKDMAPTGLLSSVADPHHVDADPDPSCQFDVDPDPDPTFHFDADPNPDPSFLRKAQNLEKCSNRLISHTVNFCLTYAT